MLRLTAILVLLLFAPLTTGQAPAPATLLDDPTGDITAQAEGAQQTPPGDHYAYLDLKSLTIQEDRGGFTFTLSVKDLNAPTEDVWSDGGTYTIQFTHNDRAFRLEMGLCFFCIPSDYAWSRLSARPVDSDAWSQQWQKGGAEGPIQDRASDQLVQRVARDDLRDLSGAKPGAGRLFTEVSVQSIASISSASIGFSEDLPRATSPVKIGDRMPDDGAGGPFQVQLGVTQTGHARLATDRPMRASNGEATTFIYTITASNIGDKSDLFELTIMGAPTGWNVILPIAAVQLEAGASRELPVLVTTPFRHLHGAEQTLHVHMTSTSDRSAVGRVEIGVIFNEIPQPAGHHNQLWFHSHPGDEFSSTIGQLFPGNDGGAYMNALQDDENDDRKPVTGFNWGMRMDPEPVAESRWLIPLDPGLMMGLDFELGKTGTVVAPIQGGAGLSAAQLGGRLILLGPLTDETSDFPYGERQTTVLANLTPDAPIDAGAGASQEFRATLTPTDEADYIPYDPANNLILELRLTTRQPRTFTTADAPKLMPGGTMTLPLLEYHDPVDDVFESLHGPLLRSVGSQQRMVNPGATAIFEVEVENARDEGATYQVALTGTKLDWARIVDASRLKMTPGASATVAVAVQVPANAADGELIDLVLSVEDIHDPTARGLIRLLAEVDTDAEHANDAAPLASADKQSPGLPLAWLIALGVALASRRR